MTAPEGRKKGHSRLNFGISVDLPSDEDESHTTNTMNAISMMRQSCSVDPLKGKWPFFSSLFFLQPKLIWCQSLNCVRSVGEWEEGFWGSSCPLYDASLNSRSGFFFFPRGLRFLVVG